MHKQRPGEHSWANKSGQERPKSSQEEPKSGQERPKSGQEQPKSGQEQAKSDLERAKSGPRAAKLAVLAEKWPKPERERDPAGGAGGPGRWDGRAGPDRSEAQSQCFQ